MLSRENNWKPHPKAALAIGLIFLLISLNYFFQFINVGYKIDYEAIMFFIFFVFGLILIFSGLNIGNMRNKTLFGTKPYTQEEVSKSMDILQIFQPWLYFVNSSVPTRRKIKIISIAFIVFVLMGVLVLIASIPYLLTK